MKTLGPERPSGQLPRRGLFLHVWVQKPWAALSLALICAAGAASLSLLLDQREILNRFIARESAQFSWMVFLSPGADRASVADALRTLPGTQSLRFISEDEAYDAVLRDPDLSQSLILTGRNPFPASYEVRWETPFLTADYLARAAEKIAGAPGIDRVGYDIPRVERLDVMQRLSKGMDLLLNGGFWLAAFLFLFHLGRIAFFPHGPFPGRRLFAAFLLGMLAGEAGFLAARSLTLFQFPEVLLAGPALALLAVFVQES